MRPAPLDFRIPARRAARRRRGHAPARAGAARRSRADRLRPHQNPAPVAAAHLASPEAARRSRPGRPLPRGELGVLSPRRARRRRRHRADAGRPARSRRSGRAARSRAARRGARRARRRGADLFQPARRRMGPHPPPARRPMRRSRARSRPRSPTGPIRSLLDLGTGTGRMLELFGPEIERGLGIDMSLDMLSLARARLERAGAEALQRAPGRHLRAAGAEGFLRRRAGPSGAALPRRRRARDRRGRAHAASAGPAAGRRLRAARSGIPARGARASAPRLCARDRRAMDERGRARRRAASHAAAGAGLGRKDRRVALARARSAARAWCRPRRELRDEWTIRARQPPRRRTAHPRLVRVLPAEDRGDGAHAVGIRSSGSRRCGRISSRSPTAPAARRASAPTRR